MKPQKVSLILFLGTIILTFCNTMILNKEQTTIDNWQNLEGSYGRYFDVQGNIIAATQDLYLSVWNNNKLIQEYRADTKMVGAPTIVGNKIYWGNGWLDIDSQIFTTVSNIERAFYQNMDSMVMPSPMGQYLPVNYAWSPDGSFLLASLGWFGSSQPKPSKVIIIIDGNFKKKIWRDYCPAPKTALITDKKIILGSKEIMVYNTSGHLLRTLPTEMEPERLELNRDESFLLVQNNHSLSVWDTKSWGKVVTWKGPWIDASISPSGKLIAAVGVYGKLHLAGFDRNLDTLPLLELPDLVEKVKLTDDYLIATFSSGKSIRLAFFKKERK